MKTAQSFECIEYAIKDTERGGYPPIDFDHETKEVYKYFDLPYYGSDRAYKFANLETAELAAEQLNKLRVCHKVVKIITLTREEIVD